MFAGCATGAMAEDFPTLEVNTKRLIRIDTPVDVSVLAKGAHLISLAEASDKPVYVFINSPGGGVYEGLQFVSAMNIVKSRGVTIKCFVSNMAMSMAFYIYTQCSERYALPQSLFLWHPVKVGLRGMYGAEPLRSTSDDISRLEEPLIKEMISKVGLDEKTFRYHYKNETVWVTNELVELVPAFISTVLDYPNVENLFMSPFSE